MEVQTLALGQHWPDFLVEEGALVELGLFAGMVVMVVVGACWHRFHEK